MQDGTRTWQEQICLVMVIQDSFLIPLAGLMQSKIAESFICAYVSRGGAGFKPIADLLHSAGLKFGIHVMRGIYASVVAENQPVRL